VTSLPMVAMVSRLVPHLFLSLRWLRFRSTFSFFFCLFFFFFQSTWFFFGVCIMLAAVERGDVKKLAELMRQDPGFEVNMDLGRGNTLLHFACEEDNGSPVIPLLLAHPDIDVNVKNNSGSTPFFMACSRHASCVREMLKDSRMSPPMMVVLHSGLLLIVSNLTSLSAGSPLGGRWISGHQGRRRRMPFAGQRSSARQKWRPCWNDSRRTRWKPDMR